MGCVLCRRDGKWSGNPRGQTSAHRVCSGRFVCVQHVSDAPRSLVAGPLGRYSGGWLDGKSHGIGTIALSNGPKCTGEWNHGIFMGRGKLTFANGSCGNLCSWPKTLRSPASWQADSMTTGVKYEGELLNYQFHGS